MQITRINSFNGNSSIIQRNNVSNNQAQNLQFGNIANKTLTTFQKKRYEWFIVDMINYVPSVSGPKLAQYINNKNDLQMDFLHKTAKKLYNENYKNKTDMPANALEMVEEVAFSVKKPDRLHNKIITNPDFSFEDCKNLIFLSNESKEKYSLIRKLLKVKNPYQENANLPATQIQEIVTSPNAKKLNKEYDKFSPYISLTYKDKDFTAKLIKELEAEQPSFDPEELQKVMEIERARRNSTLLERMPLKTIEDNYDSEVLSLFIGKKMPTSTKKDYGVPLAESDVDFYTYVLKTTNKENIEIRKSFLDQAFWRHETPETTTVFLNKLDTDENFRKIYTKMNKEEHPLTMRQEGSKLLMYYVDSVGSDVALKNFKNFADITQGYSFDSKVVVDTVDELRKNLNNKFYISDRDLVNLRAKERDMKYYETTFPKLRSTVARASRKFKYEFMPKVLGKGEPVELKMNMSFTDYVSNIEKEAAEIQKMYK